MRVKLLSGNDWYKFLPITVQGLHSVDLTISSLFMYGEQKNEVLNSLPQVSGWPACVSSDRDSCRTFGKAIFLSIHRTTHRSHMKVPPIGIYVRIYMLYCSSLVLRIQSQTSLSTASSPVRKAIICVLKTFPIMLSSMGIWGLAVRGVLTLEVTAGEARIWLDCWFAARDDSSNQTRVVCFFDWLDGMVILFIGIVWFFELDLMLQSKLCERIPEAAGAKSTNFRFFVCI